MAKDDSLCKIMHFVFLSLDCPICNLYVLSSLFYWYVQERSRIIFRFADLLEKHSDEVAALETWDNGKPYEQAANVEIPMVIRIFRYYAGMLTDEYLIEKCYMYFQMLTS